MDINNIPVIIKLVLFILWSFFLIIVRPFKVQITAILKAISEKCLKENLLRLCIALLIIGIIMGLLCFHKISVLKREIYELTYLKPFLGIYWDKQSNPYCPHCKSLLTDFYFGETKEQKFTELKCLKCNNSIIIKDTKGNYLTLDKTQQLLKERR